MKDFVETLGSEALIEKTEFLKFEEVLKRCPTRNQQWRKFCNDKMNAIARAWMQEREID